MFARAVLVNVCVFLVDSGIFLSSIWNLRFDLKSR